MPSLPCRAIRKNAGMDMSKCWRGGSHQPPWLFGGQKLVAVKVTVAWRKHHLGSALWSHINW